MIKSSIDITFGEPEGDAIPVKVTQLVDPPWSLKDMLDYLKRRRDQCYFFWLGRDAEAL